MRTDAFVGASQLDACSSDAPAPPPASSLDEARRVIVTEAHALLRLAESLDCRFDHVIELILQSPGRVVVTGVGKSGLVGRKTAATLASTGTPAFFLHPGDARHGDLGMVARGDVVLALSYSGETEELLGILPALKERGARVVAVTANDASRLSLAATLTLLLPAEAEACPLRLAPTTSSTATMALGDALAVALLLRRGFDERAFAALHPAGALGRRLQRVRDIMRTGAALPLVYTTTPMRDALFVVTARGLGVTGVCEPAGALVGVVTDGDLRRALAKNVDILGVNAADVMTRDPKHVAAEALASAALHEMQRRSISCLFVLDVASRPVGILHLHDLLRANVA
jgi:arabinose-5-phosphate isomerase